MDTGKFKELDKEIIDFIEGIESNLNLPIEIKYQYLSCSKQKELIKIVKIADQFSFLLKAEILVVVNMEYFDALTDDIKIILIERELDKITVNHNTGAIKFSKPSIQVSTGLVNKHGYENVERALESQRALQTNKEEQ
jgi:hypothetical protein